VHENYWTKKLTLPVNHPFWQEHRPGDRWNCKCSLQQTDEPVNAEALEGWTPPLPMPGLDNNPADDGKLFSDTHPYYTDSYPGADIAVRNALNVNPAWIPAKTIANAEEFATQFVKENGLDRTFKGKVSYKGLDLTMANEINNTLAQAFGRFNMPKISGIKAISGSSATGKKVFSSAESIAAYDPIQKGIYLNSDILGSPEKLNQYLKRSREAFELVKNNLDKLSPAKRAIAERYIKAGRELVDDSLQGAILHELGHHVQWNVLPSKLINEIGDKLESFAVKISGYSGTNKSEYIAESFVSWFRGEKRIDSRLKDFFDSNLKEVPQIQKILKRSPSSIRRTEEEKAQILRAWKQRTIMRENEKEIASALKMKVPKRGMTFDEANEQRSNPRLLESRAYWTNCQCCVVSHELRMRGFDVEAIARVKKPGHVSQILSMRTQQAWIDPKTNKEPEILKAFDFKRMTEKATEIGRYHVRFLYSSGNGGHIITFERTRNGFLFYDPQTGAKYKNLEEITRKYESQTKSQIKYDTIEFYRVDNLTIGRDYIKAVKKK
jgi:hypothetical protein